MSSIVAYLGSRSGEGTLLEDVGDGVAEGEHCEYRLLEDVVLVRNLVCGGTKKNWEKIRKIWIGGEFNGDPWKPQPKS